VVAAQTAMPLGAHAPRDARATPERDRAAWAAACISDSCPRHPSADQIAGRDVGRKLANTVLSISTVSDAAIRVGFVGHLSNGDDPSHACAARAS